MIRAASGLETATSAHARGSTGMSRLPRSTIIALLVGAAVTSAAGPMTAGAAVASRGAWSWQPARIDGLKGLTAVSCPSTRFCAAVDTDGDVLTTTKPSGGRHAWNRVRVDHSSLTAISCPTRSLCVAVDHNGHAVTSTDPSAGSSKWSSTAITLAPLSGVTCVSDRRCIAVDLAGNLIVSPAPAGEAAAWRLVHVDYDTSPGCLEDAYSQPNCQPGFSGVACPSATECVFVDNERFSFTILDKPGSTTPIVRSNQYAGPFTGEYDALACISGALCIGSCPAETGTGGCLGASYGDGSVIAWDPRTWQPSTPTPPFITVTHTQIRSIWCHRSTCFAADTQGNIYTSSDITTHGSHWSKTYASDTPVTNGTCPSTSECVATDGGGQIIIGRLRRRRALARP